MNKEKGLKNCIICHTSILDSDDNNEGLSCDNDHPVHRECLKNWIITSTSCPLCQKEYSPEILESFNSYIEEVKNNEEKKKREEYLAKEKEETLKKEGEKFLPEHQILYDNSLKLQQEKRYKDSIPLLWEILDTECCKSDDNRFLKVKFLLGYAYYKVGRPTLSIKQLMKVVRIDFGYPLAFYYLGKNYDTLELNEQAEWAYVRAQNNLNNMDNNVHSNKVNFVQKRLIKLKSTN